MKTTSSDVLAAGKKMNKSKNELSTRVSVKREAEREREREKLKRDTKERRERERNENYCPTSIKMPFVLVLVH